MDYSQPPPPSVNIVDSYLKDLEAAEEAEPAPPATKLGPVPTKLIQAEKTSTSPAEVTIATADPIPPPRPGKSQINLKEDFERDYVALGQ
jgi:hypothetical protein